MKKFLKWGAIVAGSLIVIIIAALLLIPMFVDVGRFKPLIEKQVTGATGRPFSVGDDLRLSLFPWAGLTFSDLRMGNPPEFAEKEFLTMKSFDVRVKLLPLIFKDIQVQRLILNEPNIVLIKDKNGRGNWEMPQKPADTKATGTPAEKSTGIELPIKALFVGDLAINKGTAEWIDHTTGLRKQATDLNLKLKDVSLDQPIRVAFSGRLDGQPLALDGTIGPVGKQIGQGAVALDISLSALKEFKMKLKGQVENLLATPRVDLAVDLAEFSPRKLVAALGQAFPVDTSDPKALNRVAFTAKIKADPANLVVSDGKLNLDDSTLNLTAKVANFSKPDVAFDINLDQIDVDRYLPSQKETKAADPQTAAKPKSSAPKAAKESPPADKPLNLPVLAVDGRLKAGKITINKRDIQDVQLILKGKEGPIKLGLSARLQEGPVSVDGTVGPFGPQPGQQSVPLNLTVNAINELKLQANGKVLNAATRPGVDVAIKVDEFSPRKLLAAFGQPFPAVTSDPKAINRVAFSAKLKADSANVSVSDGKMILDDSKMDFSLRAAEFTKPDVAFDLSIDQINLDRYLPPKTDKTAAGETPAGSDPSSKKQAPAQPDSGKSPMNYDPLRRLVLDGQLKVGKLTVNNMKIQNLLLKISGKNGALNLDPFSMNLYDGNLSGKGNLNVQQNVPKTGIDLSINKVQIGPLLRDAIQKDFLEGSTQAQLNLAVTGDTPEKIRQSLNGRGELKFNDGAVKGFDLAAMARNVKAAFGLEAKAGERPRTDFTELNVPFTITDGVADTPKSSMKSPFVRLEASGKADLVKETLDFLVEPKAVATIKGQGDEAARSGILVPVIVSGTFEAPKFRPDLKRMITQQIDKGALESEPAKKILEKEEVKKFEQPAKQLLQDILKKP